MHLKMRQAEASSGGEKEGRLAPVRLHQVERPLRLCGGEDEAGEAGARAEIDHWPLPCGQQRQQLQRISKVPRLDHRHVTGGDQIDAAVPRPQQSGEGSQPLLRFT